MTTVVTTNAYGSPTSITISMNSLAAGSYATSSSINLGGATDAIVEVTIADISESANKQVIVYAEDSLDNTTFTDGTVPANLVRLGYIDMTGGTTTLVKTFRLSGAFGGTVAQYHKLVIFNDAGVSLASSGNSARFVPITIASN